MPFIGMGVSGLVVILFLADLAAGFPFQRVTIPGDVGFIVAGAILAYMSWSIMDRPRR
jgi:Kef-type K+ transport system membrane component KefB